MVGVAGSIYYFRPGHGAHAARIPVDLYVNRISSNRRLVHQYQYQYQYHH